MKYKFLIPITFSIILGIVIGKTFFTNYNSNPTQVFYEGEGAYFVELGIYETKEEIKDLENYLIILEEDGYHLYGGITKNVNNKDKILTTFQKEYPLATVKEKSLTNTKFLQFLTEYDKIVSIVETDQDIKTMEEIIIKNYKELVIEDIS